MKISLLLTTYNGSRFLAEQLESIYSQTVQPDEVLIFDDCSADGGATAKCVNDFIASRDLRNWTFTIHPHNLGWKENFRRGLIRVTGDYVFLCDQDDIWDNTKIEKMVALLGSHPNMNVLACNYSLLNQRDSPVRTNSTQKFVNNLSLTKIQLHPLFHLVGRPGCTYGVRMSFVNRLMEMWPKGYPHDKVLWIAALLNQSLYIYNEVLIRFRRHDSNASGNKPELDSKKRGEMQRKDLQLIEDLIASRISMYDDSEILNRYLKFAHLRQDMLGKRNLFQWMEVAYKYHLYYTSCKSLAADLISIFK